ncbi:MAG: hypothetical protein ACRD3D_02305 [Terriglobia bacterium]
MSDQTAAGPPHLTRRIGAACWLCILAATVSSLWFFESRGLSNLYGDGIAHVEGARRLFDSLTPGYQEIGSVWLPLFHLLAAPLALNDTLWRTGLAGSFVASVAFALSAWFLFRLSFEMNSSGVAAAVTLAFFLISLNVLYVAATPLTEPLAVLWAVLVVYGLFRFQQSGRTRIVVWTAIAAFFGTLTRYDGWSLLPFAALFLLFCRRRGWKDRLGETLLFCLIAGLGPALWLAHNAYRFHNPLQFYNGPYSAQAIYLHQLATTGYRYPTDGSVWLSVRYYVEDLRLVFGPWSLELAALGLVAWILNRRMRERRAAALLFLVPVCFYAQSLAHGSVPIYVPTLPPHAYYNLRYGAEMAPALALLPSFLVPESVSRRKRLVLGVILCAILTFQALGMAWSGARRLATVRESILNTPCKSLAEQDVIRFFRAHYDGERVLAEAGAWPCLNPSVGIPYRKTLTPRNRKYWRQLRFGAAKWVGWVIRRRYDSVDALMRAYPPAFSHFQEVLNVPLPHHEQLEIYRRRRR